MHYSELNEQILKLVGGRDNISGVAHCVTRLRLSLKDRSVAKTEQIKNLDGVIDVVSNDVAYQIIIGTHVTDVYDEFMVLYSGEAGVEHKGTKKLSLKQIPTTILAVISESMTSIIEVLIGAGMIAGVLSLFSILGIVSPESSTYQIFETLKSSVFTFLPVFLAASSAKRLNVNPYVAMMLATTVLSTNISGVEGLSILGYNLPTIDYANTFIPILLGVWFLGLVSKFVGKVIPKSLHMFFVPAISLMIVLPVMLIAFGPVGMWIGNGLNWLFSTLAENIGYWIVIVLYAAFQPFLIIFGAANFMFPLSLQFFADLGVDPIFTPAATISDIAVCGAMIGYLLRTKNKKEKNTFGTIGFSALMGVTEPAIFGIFLKYRRPFIAVIVGGGIGGLIAGIMGVEATSLAWGLAGLPAYLAGGTDNFLWMVGSCVVGFIVAAMVAFGLGIPQTDDTSEMESTEDDKKSKKGKIVFQQVSSGVVMDISEVSDKAFSSGAMGKGIAVKPIDDEGEVISPVSGVVTVVFPTKHAYGISTVEGIEVLVHIGIDTVNLDGEGFTSHVSVGDTVKAGAVLASVDFKSIKDKGFDPVIMVIVTNTPDFLEVLNIKDETIGNKQLSVII